MSFVSRQQQHFHNCYPGELVDFLTRLTCEVYKYCPYPAGKIMIAEALQRQGLRYDELREEVVYDSPHGMTLRSHILPVGVKAELEDSIVVCGLADLLDGLRENVTEICYIKDDGTVRRINGALMNHTESGSTIRLDRGHYTAWCISGDCPQCLHTPLVEKDKLRLWDVDKKRYRIIWLGSILTVNRVFLFI
jgi:hypothetical protein